MFLGNQEGESISLKQEGESCGSSRSEICGICVKELDCNAPMDMCGKCVKKSGILSTIQLESITQIVCRITL